MPIPPPSTSAAIATDLPARRRVFHPLRGGLVLDSADQQDQRFVELLERLGRMSVQDYYNPYRMFDWPESLDTDRLWMSKELMSVYGTPEFDMLGEQALIKLSVWESINFYSVNVHGIRELLGAVVPRMHSPGFETPSDFFHHFIGEENEHMWFFAEFCKRYGGRIYPFPQVKTTFPDDPDLANFLVFARILLFEEIVDYYNSAMAADETLHTTIRDINRIHHQDESRHIAFGRELVTLLYRRMADRLSAEEQRSLRGYLRDYLEWCQRSFYSLDAYLDAGIEDPLAFRTSLLENPERKKIEMTIARKPISFLRKLGLYEVAA
jgi:P-aminobenzoate N-oxygenase AurF